VLPPIVERQIRFAEAVASGLRLAASNCPRGLEALRTRLVQGAQTIDTLIALVRVANFTARLNHDTLVEIGNERANCIQAACAGESPDYQRGSIGSGFDDAGTGLDKIRRADMPTPYAEGNPQ
jgi:hypothetical protein